MKNLTAKIVTATVLGAISCFTAGCSVASDAQDTGWVTYAEPNSFKNLYPPSGGYYPNGGVLNNITDRLLWQDPDTLELHPWIATDLPEVNADSTEFTFHLRDDVTYSDGSKLDARNVAKNYDLFARGDEERMLTPSEQLPGYERSEVVDDYTVKFYFSQPSPGFPQSTSAMNQGLLSNAALDMDDSGFAPGNAEKVIGSGPFFIADEKLGTELTLKRRDDYNWGPPDADHHGPADIEGVEFVLAEEDSVRVGSLVAHQADVARQIEAPNEQHLTSHGVEIFAAPTRGVNNTYHFHFRHPLLQDQRVREAIIAAVDRDQIVDTLYSESYPKASSILAQTAVGYREQKGAYDFDPDKANRLLDEAGWQRGADGIRTKDGERLSVTFNESVPQPRSREMFTKVQEMLRAVGVEAHLNPGDRAAQQKAMKDIDTVQIRHSMVGRANVDTIATWVDGNERNSFLNKDEKDGSLGDEKLQRMVDEFYELPTEKERLAAAGEIQDYLTEKAYVLPMFEEPQVFGHQDYVKGFATEPIGRPTFYGVELDQTAGGDR